MSARRVDLGERDWIVQVPYRVRRWRARRPLLVEHYVPIVFERYAKILHPSSVRLHQDVDQAWLRSALPRRLQLGGATLDSSDEVSRASLPWDADEPIRWSSLAQRVGVTITQATSFSEIMDCIKVDEPALANAIYSPSEGDLDGNARAAILAASAAEGHSETFYWFNDVLRAVRGDVGDEEHVLAGDADDLAASIEGFGISPELLWPGDRAWCVCSEYDTEWSIIGGSRSLIDALVVDDRIELVICEQRSAL